MKHFNEKKILQKVCLLCFLVFSLGMNAQDKIVTGTVTSSDGEPLPGVNIVQKGTANGVVSDFDGNYSIDLIDNQGDVLVFSYLGFQTLEETVGNRTTVNATMAEDSQQLDEVVVIGYGTQKKANITGAVASFDAEGLEDRPLARLDQALVGQLAGVRVKQTSGIPGAGFTVQVRGTGSINASSEPLYVIDGFPLDTEGQPSNINPNDIESIQVLKDAASAAIYGSRGANGVVLITTKKGKTGKPNISFNTYTGWNETVKKLDVLSSEEWVERAKEHIDYAYVRNYGGQGATSSDTNAERRAIIGLGPDELNTGLLYDERWLQPGHPGLDYVDWQDLFFRKGFVQSYQLSASGGTENTKYYVSGDYLDQAGVAIGVNLERLSVRANVEVTPSDKVKFGLNIAPSYNIIKDPGVEGKDAITHLVVSQTPVVESAIGALRTNTGEFSSYPYAGSRVSPIAEALNRQRSINRFRNIATVFFEYEFLEGLRYRGSINSDLQMNTTNSFTPSWIDRNRTASGSKDGETRTAFVNEHTLNYVNCLSTLNMLSHFPGFQGF